MEHTRIMPREPAPQPVRQEPAEHKNEPWKTKSKVGFVAAMALAATVTIGLVVEHVDKVQSYNQLEEDGYKNPHEVDNHTVVSIGACERMVTRDGDGNFHFRTSQPDSELIPLSTMSADEMMQRVPELEACQE